MPSNTVLISGPAVGATQILIWSYSCVFLPPMSTASYQNECVFFCGSSQGPIYLWTVCLVDPVDLICSLCSCLGGFWIFFLSHTAPGFQLWFYFHLWIWVVHWGLLLRLPWRTRVCLCEVWRWCSCLGCRGSGTTMYSGELSTRAAGNIVL